MRKEKTLFAFMLMTTFAIATVIAVAPTTLRAAETGKSLWTRTLKSGGDRNFAIGAKYTTFSVDRRMLGEVLAAAPMEVPENSGLSSTIIEIPTPDGDIVKFRLEESPMLAPEVARQFPTWKTYQARGIDDPTATARFDINANGFHGYIVGAKGTFLIDPYSSTEQNDFVVYYKGALSPERDPFTCGFRGDIKDKKQTLLDFNVPQVFSNGTQLRNFKFAISATKQYTAFFGNNQTTAFAAVQTTVNRMIVVYRRELATTFTIVSDLRTVFTEANDGGFTNNSNQALDRNQVVLDQTYGNANYDIGHVLSVSPNPDGLAASPSLCDPTGKAQGFTGAPTPQGDGFDVDYVAHEVGHQFAMSHTFNNDADGSCSTRSVDSAFEPASGVTIMGYAGICGPRNLAANSVEYFNLRSFDQSLNYLQTTVTQQYPTCGASTATSNTPPTVTAPASFNVPKQTPFTLTASATDANNDALTFSWEEFDLGAATRSTGAVDNDEDGTARPIFRAYNPSASPSRTFPSLPYILNNANIPAATYQGTLPNAPTTGSTNGYVCAANEDCVTGERLPSISRTMNFRVTVRDNNPNGGGIADAQTQVIVNAAAGPFVVTTQDTPTTWAGNSTQTITWNVAGTTANNIDAANVRISLSTDGGQTFPTVLLESTPNDGTEAITVPNTATTTARIKVEAVGNIFFDINNANFTISTLAARAAVRSDFDGDGRTDVAVFRPSEGNWYLNRSTAGFGVVHQGGNGDLIVPADFDGDRRTDFTVWRPSDTEGEPDFYELCSGDSTLVGAAWGVPTDEPAIADYDGDGKSDFAVWRPSTGDFFVLQSQSGALRHYRFGTTGDRPVVADYDGDGKADFAVFRPSTATWYIAKSTDNSVITTRWGTTGDIPVFADYDGDSKVDVAVFRPSDGVWYIQKSTGGNSYVRFGLNGDVPAPGDYDGDGKYDQAVYRNGVWYINASTAGFSVANFGVATDVATPGSYPEQ